MSDYTLWDLLSEQDEQLCASTAVPLDTCSSTLTDTPPTPHHDNSQSPHVICDVPLAAPIPLPCYYPSFLLSDSPDTTSYTRRAPKRKRGADDSDDDLAPKRRFSNPPLATSHHIQRSRQRRHHPWETRDRLTNTARDEVRSISTAALSPITEPLTVAYTDGTIVLMIRPCQSLRSLWTF